MSLLSVKNLTTHFHTRNGIVRAVNSISYDLKENTTLGIVGESGSGKSVSTLSILKLIPPAAKTTGEILFDGVDLLKLSDKKLRDIRGDKISMIFQDPMTCLNPYMKIGNQIMEPLFTHFKMSKEEATNKALKSLEEVGIQDGKIRMNQYPHEFSGGMRQRIMIAMALITEPKLIIADEPTTALDVTVQAQILELILKLQENHNTAVIFITHDLGVIANIADEVLVMYGGQIVERGKVDDIFYKPSHPYTSALLKSIPKIDDNDTLFAIDGMPPDMSKEIKGCSFAPRCQYAISKCNKENPYLRKKGDQYSACLRLDEDIL